MTKAVAADLKTIYRSLTIEEAEQELTAFAELWDEKYATISQSWQRHWPNLITLFDYPDDIRWMIYTTNAIKSLNTVIRRAVDNCRVFPHDQATTRWRPSFHEDHLHSFPYTPLNCSTMRSIP